MKNTKAKYSNCWKCGKKNNELLFHCRFCGGYLGGYMLCKKHKMHHTYALCMKIDGGVFADYPSGV